MTKQSFINRADIKFWAFLVSCVAGIIIWGTQMDMRMISAETAKTSVEAETLVLKKSLESIDKRLYRIELKLGVDKN